MTVARKLIVGVCLVALGVVAGYALATNRDTGHGDTGGDGILVVVATVDIPAGTSLDPLIDQEQFETIVIATSTSVRYVVTDIGQLRGMTTTTPIYENEQIPLARISATP